MTATVLFAGGGTGGHLFPGIAVADELRRRDSTTRIVFVGSARTIESSILSEYAFEHRTLPVESLSTLKKNPLRFTIQNWHAWRAASQLLKEIQPAAVVGLGGFASAPIVWVASRKRIPIILLEQNLIPGRTTRWLCRFAQDVCVSFEETRARLTKARRLVVTGNPVRAEIALLHGDNPTISRQGTSTIEAPELLILGGSQGADSLNEAVLLAIRRVRDAIAHWTVVHQTGSRQVDQVRATYRDLGMSAVVEPFIRDLPSQYARSSLVISRAGATTLAELACAGKAMILLPYPQATDDHQRANAKAFVDRNAAAMVDHASNPDDTASNLSTALLRLVDDSGLRASMGRAAKQLARPDAAQDVASVIVAAFNQ